MPSADEAVFIVTLRDQLSVQADKMAATLENLTIATGGTDKSITKAEKSFASWATKAGVLDKSLQGTAASTMKAATAADTYAAATQKVVATQGKLPAGAEAYNRVLQQAKVNYAEASAAADAYRAAIARADSVSMTSGTPRIKGQFASSAVLTEGATARAALPAAAAAEQNAAMALAAREAQGLTQAEVLLGGSTQRTNVPLAEQGGLLSRLGGMSNSTRYALYAVSQSLATMGAGLLALPVLSALVASHYQRDFATVERALAGTANYGQKNFAALKNQLLDLSTQLPVSFKQITDIAAAGAQLGINPAGLTQFTKVVSELTATTNLTADAAENLLGKFKGIAGLAPANFEKLASSVLNVGVNSASTEQQIAKIGTQIIGMGKEAGFTIPQVVGISGAIASVSSAGQDALARGAFTRMVTKMQDAVGTGGPILDAFAKTAGVSASTVQSAFGTDKFAPLFTKFIGGLKGIQDSGGNANAVLEQMGITSVRDRPLWLNLAGGFDVLKKAMADAQKGWDNQDILALHYSKINDTLTSKTIEFGNTFMKVMNSIGGASTGPLQGLMTNMTGLLKSFGDFASTNQGQTFLVVAAGAAVLLGTTLLVSSGMANLVAGINAGHLAYTKISEAIVAYKAAQVAANGASLTGAAGLSKMAGILTNPVVLGLAAAAVGIGLVVHELDSMKASSEQVSNALTTGTITNLEKFIQQGDQTSNAWSWLNGGKSLEASFSDFQGSLNKAMQRTTSAAQGFGGSNSPFARMFSGADTTAFTTSLNTIGNQLATLASSDLPSAQRGFGLLAGQTDGTQKSLMGLLNTMPAYKTALTNQLTAAGVAVTNQELVKTALGATSDAYLKTAGSAAAFIKQQQVNADFQTKLNSEIDGGAKAVTSFDDAYAKSVQPLTDFNSVVGQVQAGLTAAAQAQAKAVGGKAQAKDFYDGQTVSLQQFTDQLTKNNDAQQTWASNLIIVQQKYGTDTANQFIAAGYTATNSSLLAQLANAAPAQGAAYVKAQDEALALSSKAAADTLLAGGTIVAANGGAIGADTAAQIALRLRQGFSPAQIMAEFNLKFNDNPATPKVNTAPATNAIQTLYGVAENTPKPTIPFKADTQPALNPIQGLYGYSNKPPHPSINVTATTKGADDAIRGAYALASNPPRPNIILDVSTGAASAKLNAFYNWARTSTPSIVVKPSVSGSGLPGNASGGFTGYGNKYEPAGIVHAGEFVFTKEATSRIGIDELYRMMYGQKGSVSAPPRSGGYADGGLVSGSGFSTLDAQALQAIMALANRPVVLYTDDRIIAESASRGSTQLAYRGTA